MYKFLNTLLLLLATLAVGSWLYATDYPGGGGAADGFTDPTATNTWTADQTYEDNVKLTLGTGGDADISYDGSVIRIAPAVAGSGGVSIDTNQAGGSGVDGQTLNLNTTSGGANGPGFMIQHNSGSPGDGDEPFNFFVRADDSGGTSRLTHSFDAVFDDVTSTTMDSHWQFRVMSDVNAGNFDTTATLSIAGVWTDAPSFREFKEPERQLNTASVLTKLRSLDVYRFRNKGAPDTKDEERHISPTADDFYNAFKAGKDPRVSRIDARTGDLIPQYGIAARDVAGVALMAIQELIKQNDKLKERLDTLEARN